MLIYKTLINIFLLPCVHYFAGAPRKEVYFMAIIDILTHYDAKKKAAHAAKTVKHGVSMCFASSSSTAVSECLLYNGPI